MMMPPLTSSRSAVSAQRRTSVLDEPARPKHVQATESPPTPAVPSASRTIVRRFSVAACSPTFMILTVGPEAWPSTRDSFATQHSVFVPPPSSATKYAIYPCSQRAPSQSCAKPVIITCNVASRQRTAGGMSPLALFHQRPCSFSSNAAAQRFRPRHRRVLPCRYYALRPALSQDSWRRCRRSLAQELLPRRQHNPLVGHRAFHRLGRNLDAHHYLHSWPGLRRRLRLPASGHRLHARPHRGRGHLSAALLQRRDAHGLSAHRPPLRRDAAQGHRRAFPRHASRG